MNCHALKKLKQQFLHALLLKGASQQLLLFIQLLVTTYT